MDDPNFLTFSHILNLLKIFLFDFRHSRIRMWPWSSKFKKALQSLVEKKAVIQTKRKGASESFKACREGQKAAHEGWPPSSKALKSLVEKKTLLSNSKVVQTRRQCVNGLESLPKKQAKRGMSSSKFSLFPTFC